MKIVLIILVVGIISVIILAVALFVKFGKVLGMIKDENERIYQNKLYEKHDVHKIVDELDEEHRNKFDEL